jgi:protein-disulfide isomerase
MFVPEQKLMISRRPALLMLALALVASPAAAKTDWTTTIAATPEGGIRIGNPAAKFKIVEFASYTCGHCKTFHEEGLPALKAKYISTGNVSFEQRSFVRNGPDFAASLLVACQPAVPALAMAGKLFAEQEKWSQPFIAMTAAQNQAITAMPQAQQPAKLAEIAGLDTWAAARGLPLAKARACLADKAAQDKLIAIRNDAMTNYKLEGTPTFGINGVPVPGVYDWASFEPKLKAMIK